MVSSAGMNGLLPFLHLPIPASLKFCSNPPPAQKLPGPSLTSPLPLHWSKFLAASEPRLLLSARTLEPQFRTAQRWLGGKAHKF